MRVRTLVVHQATGSTTVGGGRQPPMYAAPLVYVRNGLSKTARELITLCEVYAQHTERSATTVWQLMTRER